MKSLVLLMITLILLTPSCSDIETGTRITIGGAVIAILVVAGYLLLRRKQ